ncbi:hypothetical protein BWQ96_06195 [Gracilariopsis chorda]|uniref:Methyltransferase FkbM domain-containing protein n=1 Tax=Gracilariopsis chorda TaxID=448386 RepID=A0A2V3IPX1_9FLOR|nr:hypothetical protein BWQ96_06195 [Gracilariopsis chorda]|eukprot:PXF44114.1 hypothetical protein BWQ96_06195 [Gracilariopsis chorda]
MKKSPLRSKRGIALLSLCISWFILSKNTSQSQSSVTRGSLPIRHGWKAPDFCSTLRKQPQPYDPKCRSTKSGTLCNNSLPQFFSQDGEDYYLYTRHFARMKRPGIYVDVAANDPVLISNTYFLDECLGWQGICAEANPKYFKPLQSKRSCQLIPTCISDVDGNEVQFGMRGASGGILETYKGDPGVLENATETLACTTLETVLRRLSVSHVDYLSLDVEGHELHVLMGIEWGQVTIDIISVELNSNTRKPVHTFLIERGYHMLSTGTEPVNDMETFSMNDPVYVRHGLVFGRPE